MTLKISIHPTTDFLATALDEVADELRALTPDKVVRRLNVDIASAVSIALGAHPELLTHVAEIKQKLPATPVRLVEKLDTYAYAALGAHMQAMAAASDAEPLADLADRATRLRKTLASDARAAVDRGLLDAKAFAEIPRGQGRLDTARALVALAVLFRSGWSKAQNRTAVTAEELDKAAQLGVALLTALGREDNPGASTATSPADDLRLRAYTLFFNAYDECRRAMGYLRWHEDDASDIAPSLTGPRTGRARKAERNGDEETPNDASPKDESAPKTSPDDPAKHPGGGAAPT